ncbi:odorant receptor 22b-like [Frieseomelitta varia]|uniref:odorant receptor 22b-like n=1 Tax=Frieseomelitta varia TaxID=561572 RepID=UPI001CB69786|nr:odorant receptor 22b-like [Frieseomelitta varia]
MNWQTVEDQYFSDSKFFAQLVGIWPQQERFTKFFIRLFIFVLIIVALITQVSRVIVFYSTDTLMDQLIYLTITIIIPIKQYNYILNEKKMEELLSEIVIDHLMERPKEELEILDTYYKKAIIFSFIYKASISTSALMFILMPAIPPILNIIAPLNESRGREFVYPAYYFVDEQQYYYPILANMIAGELVLIAVYIATDINLIYVIYHGCALLVISGYRFKHALDDVNLYDEKYNDALMHEAYAKVCRSIEAHKRAVKYMQKIDACYVHYFLIVLGMTIVAFTFTFVKLSTMEMGTKFFTFCVCTVAQLVHLLFLTIMGQSVENSNNEIFQTIYEANWYSGSSRTQLLYVLVLRKCLNPPVLSGGGLIPLNLFSFVQVLKASFSYYTVFRSA